MDGCQVLFLNFDGLTKFSLIFSKEGIYWFKFGVNASRSMKGFVRKDLGRDDHPRNRDKGEG